MDAFELEVLTVIQDALMIPEIPPSFTPETNLFETFGLDSVDALEIVMAIKRHYGVTFTPEDEKNQQIFMNLRSLAAHVASRRQGA